MKEYKVILASSTLDLEQKVNDHLKKNWQVQGGVSLRHNRGGGSNDKFLFASDCEMRKEA